jgi:hypothetical protein
VSNHDKWKRANSNDDPRFNKRKEDWVRPVVDDELEDLFMGKKDSTKKETIGKILVAVFGGLLMISVYAFGFFIMSNALGFDDIGYRECVLVSVGFCLIRYTDAGIVKNIK